ncbi:MAG: methylated-DNA--[protein]-cysteine S-methyltransferase [Acidimicrobiia bacterium]|nr:methylated-DNA--[protein]-cysteine S-methyltransferase [Acidimicrobiia bacterium]
MTDRLHDDLADLREPAPADLLPNVLAATGLADRFVARISPIGEIYVAFNDLGVSAVDVAAGPAAFAAWFRERFDRPAFPTDEIPTAIAGRLDKAIAEGRPGNLPLDLRSVTPFQARVLMKTAEIPRGEVRPYGWVAGEIGSPSATRAVGSALARNPMPVVIPCHRVVRSDGVLGRYSMGEDANKQRLLEAEGLDVGGFIDLASRGVRLVGSDTTHIYCHPTCRDARRITTPHRVEFRSASQAEANGYRACKRCRPAVAA